MVRSCCCCIILCSVTICVIFYSPSGEANADIHGRERTLAVVKPDGVRGNHTDAIKATIEGSGFDIVKEMSLQLDLMTAQILYFEHYRKPFFQELINFMTSGPIVAMVLEHDNAVEKWRKLIGPTDPNKARIEQPNSIRAICGSSTTQNCVHGSDSSAAANREIMIIFKDVQSGEATNSRHDEL
ncbi:hypothetical protein KP509_02G099800 [Ceratopteris richardii]|uniref:Nucleoside diphosphate kinase-like domain-containing protein n=1 Tax=Ceratopteris richardii TaxID=49495 RepID=A0A8T2VH26_CERRI|nr:hypothetical protein KP509_02G099800 [Ceratopteris richardii]